MYHNQERKVYVPQISLEAVFILRRLAWAIGKPMTQTLNNAVFAFASKQIGGSICNACKDRRCSICPLSEAQLAVSDSSSEKYGG